MTFRTASRLVLAAAGLAALTAGAQETLTLEDAIQQALAKNYTIRVESFGPRIASAQLLQAQGLFDPTLRFSYNRSEDGATQPTDPFSNTRPPASIIQIDDYQASLGGRTAWGATYSLTGAVQNQRGTFNNFTDQFYSFGGVRVTQPLLRGFGFGPSLVEVRVARANRNISQWEYKQAVIDTITRVIQLYNDLWFSQQSLATARRSRDLAEQLLHENERRVAIGSMAPADVTVARTRVALRQEGIVSAERNLLDVQNVFRQLLTDSTRPEIDSSFLVATPPVPIAPVLDKPGDLQRALELRPDFQQAKAFVTVAKAQKSASRSSLLPQVDFVGSYGYNGSGDTFHEAVRDARRAETESWSAGAVVSLPIPLREGRGRYYAAKYSLQRAETQLQRTEQDIVVQVGNAAGRIDTSAKRVEIARFARQLAEESLTAELKRLRVGQSTTFTVLQFQDVLAQAEFSEYRAIADYNQALAEYDRQIGTTLTIHGVTMEDRR
jgi:outer membrane protein TolC